MAEHKLKTWPDSFRAVERGDKTFEARVNDRAFDVGDVLVLQEWDPSPYMPTSKYMGEVGYTKRELRMRVTHILHGGRYGIEKGHCVMSIKCEASQ